MAHTPPPPPPPRHPPHPPPPGAPKTPPQSRPAPPRGSPPCPRCHLGRASHSDRAGTPRRACTLFRGNLSHPPPPPESAPTPRGKKKTPPHLPPPRGVFPRAPDATEGPPLRGRGGGGGGDFSARLRKAKVQTSFASVGLERKQKPVCRWGDVPSDIPQNCCVHSRGIHIPCGQPGRPSVNKGFRRKIASRPKHHKNRARRCGSQCGP